MNQNQRLALVEEAIVGLTRPKSRWQRFWSGVNWFGVIVGVPSSVASLVLLYLPQVNINLDKTLNRGDAFATQFAVVNSGNLSLHNVEFACVSSIQNSNITNNRTEPELPVEELNAGDTLSRGCGMVTVNVPNNSTLDVTVTYSYFLLPGRQHDSAHFEARRDAQGIHQWFKTIQTSTRLARQ